MSITLISGPANAGKAEVVLDAVRRHVAHGEEPLLRRSHARGRRALPARAGRQGRGDGRARRALRWADRRGRAPRRDRRAGARGGGARAGARGGCRGGTRTRGPAGGALRHARLRARARRGLRRAPGASRDARPSDRRRSPAGAPPTAPTPTPAQLEQLFADYRATLAPARAPRRRAARRPRAGRACASARRCGLVRRLLFYGFDDLTAAAAGCDRDARQGRRRRGHGVARLRAGACRLRGPGRELSRARAAGARAASAAGARASTTRLARVSR